MTTCQLVSNISKHAAKVDTSQMLSSTPESFLFTRLVQFLAQPPISEHCPDGALLSDLLCYLCESHQRLFWISSVRDAASCDVNGTEGKAGKSMRANSNPVLRFFLLFFASVALCS